MATTQIAVRVPDEVLSELDDLVRSGTYENRAAAVRAGLEAIILLRHRHQTDEAIVEGYRRIPPTAVEDQVARASLQAAIAEEPW